MVTFLPVTVNLWRAIRPTTSTSMRPLDDLDPFVEAVLGVAGLDRHGVLLDDRPGVDARVDEVAGRAGDRHAVGEGIAHRVRAGEGRQQRGVGVDHRMRARKVGPSQLHEPRRDDERSAGMP
jgi:hypothetical protein